MTRTPESFTPDGSVMLALNDICKSFYDSRILKGVNLRLEKGADALKGGSGLNKTTRINITGMKT